MESFLGSAHFGEDPTSIAGVPTDRAGEEETKRERRAAQERLVADLALVQSRSDKYFQLCVAMVAIMFLGGCLLVFLYRDNVPAITALFAATGVTLSALASLVFKFWKGKVFSGTILVLVRNLPPEDLREVIGVFAGRLGEIG
ncbi:hypothetical protein [Paraburkholderia susongensis]|uniref:hypothetical protein n=1 Tax=Paraburkholderia susongensis TaxID=1515439 RepID=UPI000A1CE3DE|nr:hypothetical protein [Paraburkholderia susongensis]